MSLRLLTHSGLEEDLTSAITTLPDLIITVLAWASNLLLLLLPLLLKMLKMLKILNVRKTARQLRSFRRSCRRL